jgi:hypothetical protein
MEKIIIILHKDFLHFSIHIAPKNLDLKHSGMIHMYKNVYNIQEKKRNKKLYALIKINIPENKPNSLVFSIADGYNTPEIKNEDSYEKELQQEMDVIITVLNKLFDEKERNFYLGYDKIMINIHNKTNNVLRNINTRTKYIKRKNIGTTFFAPIINISGHKISHKIINKTQKKFKNTIKIKKTKKSKNDEDHNNNHNNDTNVNNDTNDNNNKDINNKQNKNIPKIKISSIKKTYKISKK